MSSNASDDGRGAKAGPAGIAPAFGVSSGTVGPGALGNLGLVIVLGAQLVSVLDFRIVNVALPDMSHELLA